MANKVSSKEMIIKGTNTVRIKKKRELRRATNAVNQSFDASEGNNS